MGYEHRDDVVGGGGAGNVKHTHTHTQSPLCYTRWMEPPEKIGRNLDTCRCGHPLFKFLGYEHEDEAVGGMGSRQWQPHGVSRDTHGGWSFGKDRPKS